MEHSIYLNLVYGALFVIIACFFVYFSDEKTGEKRAKKIAYFALFLMLLGLIIRTWLLLYNYEMVIGTTDGTYKKKGGYKIRYHYYFNHKLYNGTDAYRSGIKTEYGYYYVRVAKDLPFISEIDFSLPLIDKRKRDSLQFIEFEKRISNVGYISREIFVKFVNLNDSYLYHEKSKYFGKTITYRKEYKLVHLRQSDGLRGHEILVTFDNLNRQIDVKTFMYYCSPCAKEELLAYLTFSGSGDRFTIKYFHPENPNALPKEDEIKTLKEEEWIIDEKGFFVLK